MAGNKIKQNFDGLLLSWNKDFLIFAKEDLKVLLLICDYGRHVNARN